ncbi:MAG: ribose 5-phosphate isomerase B [Dehalococcoidales bacterium]|nr:MAG: ribose 5-phosphate isomerase B [Dehalococcoidales bacterium]
MRIAVGCDHRGRNLKQAVIKLLSEAKHDYEDFGTNSDESVDYPDIAREVGEAVAGGQYEYGILICGTGIGMSMAANKVRGIRAALCHNAFGACRARQHNNANILCLSEEEGMESAPEIVNTFLTTGFEGGRHQRRIDKMTEMECS